MHTWLIMVGVLVFLWIYFSNKGKAGRQRSVLSFGKSPARQATEESVTFDDVAGVDEAKEELEEVVDFLKTPERYIEIGARIPRGVLLVGPPGTGKTLLSRAIAGEASVPFYHLSGSDFVEMFVGVGAARVRDLFDKARRTAPCIVFIDELDAMGRARSSSGAFSHEEREQTLNQLLVEMDGFDSKTGVILMGATNRPEILDQALLRPGRFDRQISLTPPDRAGRLKILEIHAREVTLADDVNLDDMAGQTAGLVGADLANLVNEAALLAARRRNTEVSDAEFQDALERIVMGLEKKGLTLSDKTRRLIAFHELGHAVVGAVLPNADELKKVTIIPRGRGLGVTAYIPDEESLMLMTETQLKHRIAGLLGGRAAELVFIGEASTGAGDDLRRATDIATDMVRRYGMSSLGLRTYERDVPLFVNQDKAGPGSSHDHGVETASGIDREVDRIIREGLELATEVLTQRKALVEALADRLLEEQNLSGDQVREALGLPNRPDDDAPPADASGIDAPPAGDAEPAADLLVVSPGPRHPGVGHFGGGKPSHDGSK